MARTPAGADGCVIYLPGWDPLSQMDPQAEKDMLMSLWTPARRTNGAAQLLAAT